jgi:hypothetical protein
LIRNEKPIVLFEKTAMQPKSQRPLYFKEMPVILVNRVVDKKRLIGKNGGPRRRRGTKGRRLKAPESRT